MPFETKEICYKNLYNFETLIFPINFPNNISGVFQKKYCKGDV